jgi:ABC-2 type transport system permease protein
MIRLTSAHTKAATLELLRYPSFSVPTLVFPAAGFAAFGLQLSAAANLVMALYAAIAVLGVAFFQFGVGIAIDRASPWQLFLRILPAPQRVRFAARIMSALAFGLTSAAVVVVLAVVATPVSLGPERWLVFLGTLLLGAVPFGLFGIALGYWLTPRGALPTANLIFLGLAFAGGMFTGPEKLPGLVAEISPFLPTRLWSDLLAAAVGAGSWRAAHAAGLVAYGVAFAAVAAWGYRRDEGERFR